MWECVALFSLLGVSNSETLAGDKCVKFCLNNPLNRLIWQTVMIPVLALTPISFSCGYVIVLLQRCWCQDQRSHGLGVHIMIYHVLVPLELTETVLINSESHKSGVAILGDPMQSLQYLFKKAPNDCPLTEKGSWPNKSNRPCRGHF